jgi:hypothetical protein
MCAAAGAAGAADALITSTIQFEKFKTQNEN